MNEPRNAGTIRDLLCRNGFCSSDGAPRWLAAWVAEVNGQPVYHPDRIVKSGDVVNLAGYTFIIAD